MTELRDGLFMHLYPRVKDDHLGLRLIQDGGWHGVAIVIDGWYGEEELAQAVLPFWQALLNEAIDGTPAE